MIEQHKKINENKTSVNAANTTQGNNIVQLKDNRKLSIVQRKLQEFTDNNFERTKLPRIEVTQLVDKKGKKKKKRKRKDPDSDDEDSSGEFVPPQAKKQKRFSVPKATTENILRRTAHRRKNVNNKYKEIYTCPACRRPLAARKKGSKNLELTRFAFTSKGGNDHEQRALTLDHYPPWAPRERALKSRGATNEEIKEDHNDPDRLRALCKKCNESHKYEKKKKVDYESETDEEGYFTDDNEPENKSFYKDFRKDPDPGSGGGSITV